MTERTSRRRAVSGAAVGSDLVVAIWAVVYANASESGNKMIERALCQSSEPRLILESCDLLRAGHMVEIGQRAARARLHELRISPSMQARTRLGVYTPVERHNLAVYVDDMQRTATVQGRQRRWSHLIADTPAELREFASKLGLSRTWIQKPGTFREHFDVTDSMRKKAIAMGAESISYFDLPTVTRAIRARSLANAEPT